MPKEKFGLVNKRKCEQKMMLWQKEMKIEDCKNTFKNYTRRSRNEFLVDT